jgi:hypothetical protein
MMYVLLKSSLVPAYTFFLLIFKDRPLEIFDRFLKIPIGVNYLTYLETQRINVAHRKNLLSTKLQVKVVKRHTSVRQKDVPSQDLRSISGT